MDTIRIMILESEIETMRAVLALLMDGLIQKNIITEEEMKKMFDKDKIKKVIKQFKDVGDTNVKD